MERYNKDSTSECLRIALTLDVLGSMALINNPCAGISRIRFGGYKSQPEAKPRGTPLSCESKGNVFYITCKIIEV